MANTIYRIGDTVKLREEIGFGAYLLPKGTIGQVVEGLDRTNRMRVEISEYPMAPALWHPGWWEKVYDPIDELIRAVGD